MDINKTFSELAQYKRIADEAKAEIERLENEIKTLMEATNNFEIFGDEHKAVWTTYEKSQFDTKKFKADHADMAAEYTKRVTQKKFTFA